MVVTKRHIGDSYIYETINRRLKVVVAELNTANRFLIFNRTKSRHLFKKTQSYGFNAQLTERLMEHCDYVCIRELNGKNDWKYYKIPKEEFILYSRHMKFEGYELQIFVPISLIYKYQIFTNNQTN